MHILFCYVLKAFCTAHLGTSNVLAQNYINKVVEKNTDRISKMPGMPEGHRVTLVMDQNPCHLASTFKSALASHRSDTLFVSKRFTALLQSPDVHWMQSLKQAYHRLRNDWLINGVKTFTSAGNISLPGYACAVKCIQMYSLI